MTKLLLFFKPLDIFVGKKGVERGDNGEKVGQIFKIVTFYQYFGQSFSWEEGKKKFLSPPPSSDLPPSPPESWKYEVLLGDIFS